jgi:hypothetical protein
MQSPFFKARERTVVSTSDALRDLTSELAADNVRVLRARSDARLSFGLAGAAVKPWSNANRGTKMPPPTSSDDPAPAPSRKPQTDRSYAMGGQQLLNRAMRQYPNASDVVDAFIHLCGDPKWVLRPSTTRTYKARIIKRIEIEVAAGRCDPDRAIAGIKKITKLLERLRGNPDARTSRLKCMDVMPEEVELISDDLQSRLAVDKPDIIDEALLGFVELEPRYGLRPCEWERARVSGPMLVVQNAKYSDYRAPGLDRRIPLERVPKKLVLGAAALIGMITKLIEMHGSWENVHDILAERLARICARLRLVRISLYSLRHAAIATWKRAKFSRIEIAALAGHISIKTASRHYAPSKHGWDPKTACVKADPQTISVVRKYSESASKFRLPEAWGPPADWTAPSPSMSP